MIICFSGTGNTARVAKRLSEISADRIIMINREFYDNPVVSLKEDEHIVWMFPIYSWGVPPIVESVINRVKGIAQDTRAWLIATCGDDSGYADRQWRRLVTNRGMKAIGAFTVEMPNTYVTMNGFDVDPKEKAASKVARSEERIKVIADAIMSGSGKSDVNRGLFPWLKSNVIYPWFVRHKMGPKYFHPTDACKGCGTCVRSCPLSNINLIDNKPCWNDVCAFCLNCYHVCPAHAVDWKNTTARKGQVDGMKRYQEIDK